MHKGLKFQPVLDLRSTVHNGASYTRAQIQIMDQCRLPESRLNHTSTSASVLCVAFEDTTLTQWDFYRILMHMFVICAYMHLCSVAVLFYSTIYSVTVDSFARIQIDLDFRNLNWSGSAPLCSEPHFILNVH